MVQTSVKDIRAGWSAFRAWEDKFSISTRRLVSSDPSDLLFLASYVGIQQIDFLENVDEGASAQKIAFMRAFLSVVASDSPQF